ncbi:MAG: phosphate acetyltransferase [Clostridia bacterium]|nr:phosphate acetyltransferase [Clostridia bacterium]
MSHIEKIKERAKALNKTVVLPETNDIRVLKAARMATDENVAKIILIGDENELRSNPEGINLDGIEIINPQTYERSEEFSSMLFEMRKEKGMTEEQAHDLIFGDRLFFGCMLVKNHIADGMVAGSLAPTANVLKSALQTIKTAPDAKLVSAFFLMEVPDCEFGSNGTFIFADSGLNPAPTPEELADIAKQSATSFEQLVGEEAVVAMLSFSTKGSAKREYVASMEDATEIAKERYPELKLDGTLQLDAAIVPEVGEQKAPGSEVAGHANVLIFPDLNAGNIGYKLVQRLAKATAIGPITQGLAMPVNDLSRGCSPEDIVGAVAITALQSNK